MINEIARLSIDITRKEDALKECKARKVQFDADASLLESELRELHSKFNKAIWEYQNGNSRNTSE